MIKITYKTEEDAGDVSLLREGNTNRPALRLRVLPEPGPHRLGARNNLVYPKVKRKGRVKKDQKKKKAALVLQEAFSPDDPGGAGMPWSPRPAGAGCRVSGAPHPRLPSAHAPLLSPLSTFPSRALHGDSSADPSPRRMFSDTRCLSDTSPSRGSGAAHL